MKLSTLIFVAAVWLATPVTGFAQEVRELLTRSAAMMEKFDLTTIRFSIAGSGYEVKAGTAPSDWKRLPVSETRKLDLKSTVLEKRSGVASANSPWEDQYELWALPQAFLKAARQGNPFLGEFKQGDTLFNLVIVKV